MTKQQEIDALTGFIGSLPKDSYLHPWLTEQLPSVASAIRADVHPEVFCQSNEEFHAGRAALVEGAKLEAEGIIAKAQATADKIRKNAINYDGMIRDRIMSAVRQIERIAND